jgi:NAD(P)-dependent dehydrogenase (short-subunit alcohol dehydrogenase family)
VSEAGRHSLEGRVAVVTGGGRGIGRAICLALARCGASVAVAGRNEDSNGKVAAEVGALGVGALGVPCDVTNAESVHRAVAAVNGRFGRVDVLVNNAGTAESETLLRTSKEMWDRLIAVNLTGTFLCTRAVLEGMLQRRRGRIINVASTAGKVGYPYVAAYCAAKSGVIGFTRAVAQEVAGAGVTINAVCPGFVDTDLTSRSMRNIVARTGMSDAEARQALENMSPQRRLMAPEEVADLVVALASDAAHGINGQAINLDGGGVTC